MSDLGEKETGLAAVRTDHGCVGDDEQDMLSHVFLPGILI
jgi:hypothetical protein